MKNTKLIELLKAFSKQEIKEFEKFVASPYFSRGRDLLPFYKILLKYYPRFENSDFTYEKIYRKLHPKVKYNKPSSENLLRVMSSELVKLAEEYLTYENLKSDRLQSRISLIEVYVTRNQKNLYSKLYSKTQKDLNNLSDGFTSKYFLNMYFFKMFEVMFDIRSNETFRSTLESQTALLNFFFLCAFCFIDNSHKNKISFNVDTKDDLIEQFMRSFDFKNFTSYLNKNKSIKKVDKEIFELCFYSLIHSLDRDNMIYISNIERLFYKNRYLFEDNHKLSFYFLLLPAYDRNNDKEKLYILYKNILHDKIFEPGKNLMPFRLYFNIIRLFAERNPEEAEKFTLKFTDSLNTDKKKSFYNFSFALLEFNRKNYGKSLEYISKVEIVFFYLKYYTKILFLQIFYELNYTEQAISMIDSFKHFLKKNQYVPDGHRVNYEKFVDCYKTLLNIKMARNKSGLKILKKNIESEGILFYMDWFLEKINEF
ncbi:MAG: hypothetical protein M3R36_04870 [Bacteroidota bacterium]|nr:hypothetical protein [Bacteroidota bacterium]